MPAQAEAHRLPTSLRRRTNKLVYHFLTWGHSPCWVCRTHHRYVVGSHRGLLDARRAHPGCNRPIVRQVVSQVRFRRRFPEGRGAADLRQVGARAG